jgi:uncharacterized protein (TIGR02001 family)
VKSTDRWIVAAALCGAPLFSQPALALTTGHVGAFSEYVFRGVVANGGAAVQGGIDHFANNGLFAGLWGSNTAVFGGSELDLYGGYLHKFSDKLMVDVGALYYLLPEDKEIPILDLDSDGTPDREDLDTLELFLTLIAGPLKVQGYYSPDYLATDEDGFYYSASYTHAISDTLSVVAQAGYTHGDGPEFVYGDDYIDYSVGVSKTLREGLIFSMSVIDTNLKNEFTFADASDDPKLLISAKQTFSF